MKNNQILWKRVGSTFCAALLFAGVLSGCQQGTEDIQVLQDEKADDEKQNAMGRYMEEEGAFIGKDTFFADLQILSDGKLALYESSAGYMISKDEGKNFDPVYEDVLQSLDPNEYVVRSAVKQDGTVALVSMYTEDEAEPEIETEIEIEAEIETEIEAVEDSSENMTEEQSMTEDVIGSEGKYEGIIDDDMWEWEYHYFILRPDGTLKQMTLTLDTDEEIYGICYTEEGLLYGLSYTDSIYQINEETGECKLICEPGEYVHSITGGTNRLYILTSNKVMIYNNLDESIQEENCMTDFLSDLYGNETGGIDVQDNQIVLLQGDTEDSVYLACKNGLYRHVIGGSIMEQLIDGNLATLGDPSFGILDMVRLENGKFIVICGDGKIYSYAYDATVSSVPTQELKVYSLVENPTIRQAITTFRKSYPDVYVNYEYGLTVDGGMTIDDAVKNLSVDILSGNSPDVFILDGLPMQTYIDQSLLLDMTPYFSEDAETYFNNIFACYANEKGMYAVPTKFKLSIIAGDDEYVNKIHDFASLIETLELVRTKEDASYFFEAITPEMMLAILEKVDSCHWIKEDGTIDRDKIMEYLEAAKRIYELEQAGITQEDRDIYQYMNGDQTDMNQLGLLGKQYNNQLSNYFYNYMQEMTPLVAGQTLGMTWDFSVYTSTFEVKKKGDFALWQNGDEKCFNPTAIASVCANTNDPDMAVDFVKTMLDADTQKIENADGWPVNQEAFEELFYPADADEDGCYGYLATSYVDKDGAQKEMTLSCATPKGKNKDKLLTIVKTVDTPVLNDIRIRNTVLQGGVNVLDGSQTVEEAANSICDKLNLYLLE